MKTCYACDGSKIFNWIDVKFVTHEEALEFNNEELEGERLDIPMTGICPICEGKGVVEEKPIRLVKKPKINEDGEETNETVDAA